MTSLSFVCFSVLTFFSTVPYLPGLVEDFVFDDLPAIKLNHDLQDSNGNTVTHIMVVYNNMRMFDLAVECGASINILNRYLQRAGRQDAPFSIYCP